MRRFTERARGDRGAVLVEFALVIPIFLLLVFGLAEYSITEAGNAAGSNAARDGARVGIIDFANADTVGSANYDLIVAAVNGRLAGLVQGTPTVDVKCMEADGVTLLPNGGKCDPTKVTIGSDMIKVRVQWTHISPVGLLSNDSQEDSAVMKIVGKPGAGGGGGGVCTLSNPTANPPTVNETGGVLSNSVTLTLTVSSAADCGTPQLSLPSESGLPALVNMTLQAPNSTTFQYVYPGDYTSDPNNPPLTQMWSAGPKTAQMQVQGGLKTASADFSVSAPAAACVFGTVTPNPTVDIPLQQKKDDTSVKNNNTVTITLAVNDENACATPMLKVTGMTSPLSVAKPMTWNGSTSKYELVISDLPGNNDTPWDSGDTGIVTISGPGGATTSVGISASG